jgi:hypothetical protein
MSTLPGRFFEGSMTIAAEHIAWAKANDFTPREVVKSVGAEWPAWDPPDWGDATFIIRREHMRLMREREEDDGQAA